MMEAGHGTLAPSQDALVVSVMAMTAGVAVAGPIEVRAGNIPGRDQSLVDRQNLGLTVGHAGRICYHLV